jgi:hypothetical protein
MWFNRVPELKTVAAAGPRGDEVAGEGDLEGQVGGEAGEVVRGKHPESLMWLRIPSRARVKEIRAGSIPASLAAWLIRARMAW